MTPQALGSAVPIFRVANLRASLEYYTNVLGFSVAWDEGRMVSVARGRCAIMLTEWAQGQRGTWVWLSVDDVSGLHDELTRRGARVRQAPTNFPWALEMQIEDLDGNVMRVGGELRKDAPFGRFLDANGALWNMAPG